MADEFSVEFRGIGSYIPPRRVTNSDIEKVTDTTDSWMRENVGIIERSRIAPDETTTDMGVKSSRIALETAGISAKELDFIICGTNTQDHLYPSTASKIQAKLGAVGATTMDVQAGCTGWLFSMRLAAGLVRGGQAHRILVVGTDALSRAMNYYDRSSALFGDGSGAAVLVRGEPGKTPLDPLFATITTPSLALEQGTFCNEEDNAFENYLAKKDMTMTRKPAPRMDGRVSLKLALTDTRAMIDKVFAQASSLGITKSDVDMFVPHQTNVHVVKALCEHAEFPFEKIPYTLDKYGGISTAGMPTGLYEHYRAGKIKKGDLVLCAGYGAGFTSGAMLFRWNVL